MQPKLTYLLVFIHGESPDRLVFISNWKLTLKQTFFKNRKYKNINTYIFFSVFQELWNGLEWFFSLTLLIPHTLFNSLQANAQKSIKSWYNANVRTHYLFAWLTLNALCEMADLTDFTAHQTVNAHNSYAMAQRCTDCHWFNCQQLA